VEFFFLSLHFCLIVGSDLCRCLSKQHRRQQEGWERERERERGMETEVSTLSSSAVEVLETPLKDIGLEQYRVYVCVFFIPFINTCLFDFFFFYAHFYVFDFGEGYG
jgi:hypothetical protein